MKINLDDPNLTAYALGELSGDLRAEMEKAVLASAEAQAFVQETRQIATLLETEFATELQQAERKPLNILPLPAPRSFWSDNRWASIAVAALLAVCAVVAAVAVSGLRDHRPTSVASSQGKVSLPPAATPPVEIQMELVDVPAVEEPDFISVYFGLQTESPLLAFNRTEIAPSLLGERVRTGVGVPQILVAALGYDDRPQRDANSYHTSFDRSTTEDYTAGIVTERYRIFGPTSLSLRSAVAERRPDPTQSTGNQMGFNSSSASGSGRRLVTGQDVTDSYPTTQPSAPPADRRQALGGADPGSPIAAGRIQSGMATIMYRPLPVRQSAQEESFSTADYGHFEENPFLPAETNPLSTFSIDVDTASYANVRRMINAGTKPPKDAVRVEEMINYFSYDYPQPKPNEPFSINLEVAGCPWTPEHRLVRIGLKGREIAADQRGASNLVFLLDVSGSMQPTNRLPLVKQAMRLLVDLLTENDRVAIVVYAGNSGVVLPSITGDRKEEILRALEELQAGGSTNGASGINLAYQLAAEHFIKGGVNRVILATDGDFNVGVTSPGELVRLAEEKAQGGVFLTVLGVGDDNLKDATMQKLADKANGNYAYLDSLDEARKVLVQQMNATLVTIAKDVKVQVEFNPLRVASYRLIGYEKRLLRKEDFNNDKIDAGEIGAGHTVTALYEVVPRGGEKDPLAGAPPVDPLKYATPDPRAVASSYPSPDLLTVKLRYKKPEGDKSELIERSLIDNGTTFAKASSDFRFAAAVAEFGLILRGSEHKGNASLGAVLEDATAAKGEDAQGYRAGFIELARKAQALAF